MYSCYAGSNGTAADLAAELGSPVRAPTTRVSLDVQLNEIMGETGCHRCGTTNPGTKSGDAIPDHQPPLSVSDGPFELYPHCLTCSREQGLEIARLKRLGLLE